MSRSSQNLSESDDRHYQNISFHASAPHRSPHAPQTREQPSHHPRPASALLQRDDLSRSEGFRADLYRPASQRDVRHQEPRLVHLPEDGAAPRQMYPHPPALVSQQHQSPPGGGIAYFPPGSKQAPPPTAPKPKPSERSSHPYRPQISEEGNGYRDSPPPPPPPTHTHPLLQQTSSGAMTQQQEQTTRQPFFNKTSAWEREEKERVSILPFCTIFAHDL